MAELTTFKLKCPECGDIMDLEADAEEIEAEDGAIVDCLTCGIESEYTFSDCKLSEDDFDNEEDVNGEQPDNADDDEEEEDPED